ncbi:MAG: CehA/McbA family metallohydrolase [Clostridia bacterium]|nr:CehA/McbA family metallohydrolase [Clostridia bacterium]
MKAIKIDYRIEKTDEKKYFFLPFNVPENVEMLEVNYSYEGDKADSRITGKEKNVIDFGLIDEIGDDVGTRGSNVRSVYLSPTSSTSGYRRMIINSGVWKIIIGAYQIRDEGVTVNYEVTFHMRKLRWLKGDTHMHTTHSDGRYTREEIAARAKNKGLDFIFITDHNNKLEGLPMPEVKDLCIIKGVEFTNYKGHLNMFGQGKPFDGTYAINTFEEFQERNLQAKERGAFQSICHPTCSLCPWLMGFENFHYDAVEVWNGPMRKDNLKAIEWWDGQLKKGRRLVAICGSDYHKDYYVTDLLASPTLWVFADSNAEDAILDAMRKGRCVLTHSPLSTMIEMTADGAVTGDETLFTENSQVEIKITGMKRKHKLKVIDNGGVFFEFTAKKVGDYAFTVPIRQKGYVRCQIEYNKGFFAGIFHRVALYFMLPKEALEPIPPFVYALTNPIYFK